MRRASSGFTLIELITVIVILGALAAVVTPRFIDLQQEADEAAVEAVAGNLASAAATNFAGVVGESGDAVAVESCGSIPNATVEGQMPNGFNFTSTNKSLGSADGDTATCAVENADTTATATFTAIYATPGP